jgi:hypothetical protein
MRFRHAALMASVLTLSASALAQGPRRDGKWEVTMTMEMPGMPAAMPPATTTQCITKEQADDPQKLVLQQPQRGNQQSDCKVSDYLVSGNKVTYSMKCTTPAPMDATGEIIYGDNTYNGTMKMNMGRGGQMMAMTMKYSAKRLGDCTQ